MPTSVAGPVAMPVPVPLSMPMSMSMPMPMSVPMVGRPAQMMPIPIISMEEYQKKFPVLTQPEKSKLFMRLLERNVTPEMAAMVLEIYASNDLSKILSFLSDYQKLVDMGFNEARVKQALLTFDDPTTDLPKITEYLKEFDKLLASGFGEGQIFEACSLFQNDILKAAAHLTATKALVELGFDEVRVREALLVCENNQQLADRKSVV